MAEEARGGPAPGACGPGTFERDTAVTRREGSAGGHVEFDALIAPGWRAGRGPHGGYLAAMLLRALIETVSEPARAPRSLTIHYARAPREGPVRITCRIERSGRSLSTLSARMEQEGSLAALALGAFSVPWTAEEVSELQMPDVAPPDEERVAGAQLALGAPDFNRHLVFQPRMGARPFTGSGAAMEVGGWLGLESARPIDAISLAFFTDALFPPTLIRMTEPATVPTVDLTIHFRTRVPRTADPDPHELCLARFRSRVVHEGFFEEDGVIWAGDGTVLVQSRQLGVVVAVGDR